MSFVVGASIVLASTWMYNSPDRKPLAPPISLNGNQPDSIHNLDTIDMNGVTTDEDGVLNSRRPHLGEHSDTDINALESALPTPMEEHDALLGYTNSHSNPSNFPRPGHESKGSMGGLIEKDSDNEKGYQMEVRSAGSSSNG